MVAVVILVGGCSSDSGNRPQGRAASPDTEYRNAEYLIEGQRIDEPYTVSLSQTEDGWWRFTEFADGPFSYDFHVEPADEARLAAKCHWQATHSESNFTLNFVAMKRMPGRQVILRGRVLTERGPQGTTTHTVADADELVATLAERFGIDEPRARDIWPRVLARHSELFETAA